MPKYSPKGLKTRAPKNYSRYYSCSVKWQEQSHQSFFRRYCHFGPLVFGALVIFQRAIVKISFRCFRFAARDQLTSEDAAASMKFNFISNYTTDPPVLLLPNCFMLVYRNVYSSIDYVGGSTCRSSNSYPAVVAEWSKGHII